MNEWLKSEITELWDRPSFGSGEITTVKHRLDFLLRVLQLFKFSNALS